MTHCIRRFLPFLYFVLFALSLLGCVSQQRVDAPLQMTQMTLQSLHERNPKALATKVCVLPDQVPAGTKFLLADAGRTRFVSDRNQKAFARFLPFADTIFEFDLFARSSSAALLGAALNLSCPETFTVLRSPEDIENGAPRMQTVTRIPTKAHTELTSIVEQTCKAAALEGTDRRYLGQHSGKAFPVTTSAVDPPTQARILRLLGIEKIPEPEPPGPKSVVRQLMDTPEGQTFGGVMSGVPIAVVSGGTIAADLAIEAGLLPKGTREARIGKACAELGVGAVQVVVGCGGMGVGAGTSGTGVGAPAGALVFLGSLGLTTTGLVNCGNGIRHLAIELWRSDDGEVLPASGSYAQTGPSTATPPKAVAKPTPPKAVAKPAETTPKTAVPEPKATTQGKGKPAASAKPSQSSSSSSSSGWRVGEDIYKPTAKGEAPNWSTVRARFWKNEAAKSNAAQAYDPAQIERMKRGLAPQRYSKEKGGMESMDLSHEPTPARKGGTEIVPRWPQDHAKVDSHRRPGY